MRPYKTGNAFAQRKEMDRLKKMEDEEKQKQIEDVMAGRTFNVAGDEPKNLSARRVTAWPHFPDGFPSQQQQKTPALSAPPRPQPVPMNQGSRDNPQQQGPTIPGTSAPLGYQPTPRNPGSGTYLQQHVPSNEHQDLASRRITRWPAASDFVGYQRPPKAHSNQFHGQNTFQTERQQQNMPALPLEGQNLFSQQQQQNRSSSNQCQEQTPFPQQQNRSLGIDFQEQVPFPPLQQNQSFGNHIQEQAFVTIPLRPPPTQHRLFGSHFQEQPFFPPPPPPPRQSQSFGSHIQEQTFFPTTQRNQALSIQFQGPSNLPQPPQHQMPKPYTFTSGGGKQPQKQTLYNPYAGEKDSIGRTNFFFGSTLPGRGKSGGGRTNKGRIKQEKKPEPEPEPEPEVTPDFERHDTALASNRKEPSVPVPAYLSAQTVATAVDSHVRPLKIQGMILGDHSVIPTNEGGYAVASTPKLVLGRAGAVVSMMGMVEDEEEEEEEVGFGPGLVPLLGKSASEGDLVRQIDTSLRSAEREGGGTSLVAETGPGRVVRELERMWGKLEGLERRVEKLEGKGKERGGGGAEGGDGE